MAQQDGFEEGFEIATEASLDVLCAEVYAKMPGAVEGYIYDQIKLVVKDFFNRSKTWRRALGPFTVGAEQTTLGLNPVDSRTNVIQVFSLSRNGLPLPRALANAEARVVDGISRWYVDPYHTVYFTPAPSQDLEDVYVSAALTPRLLDDNILQQWILDKHYEALLAGTLQRLFQEQGKPYANVTQAEYWGKRYRSELALATSAGIANHGSTQPWCYPTHSR